MIKLIKKENATLTYFVSAEEPLLQMMFNALILFSKNIGAIHHTINGKIIEIYCPNSEVAKKMELFEL